MTRASARVVHPRLRTYKSSSVADLEMIDTSPTATSPATDISAAGTSAGALDVFRLAEGSDPCAPAVQRDALEALESGGIVLLPRAGFELLPSERTLISDLRNFLVKQPGTANGRPTIIFAPTQRRIARFNFAFA